MSAQANSQKCKKLFLHNYDHSCKQTVQQVSLNSLHNDLLDLLITPSIKVSCKHIAYIYHSIYIHCAPKLAPPLLQTHLI